jgi:hypothetical protein
MPAIVMVDDEHAVLDLGADLPLGLRYPRPFAPVCATSAVCTSLRCCGPARAAGVARGVHGCGRAGGRLRSPVAGGGSWRERGAGRRQRVGAHAKGLYFSHEPAHRRLPAPHPYPYWELSRAIPAHQQLGRAR